MPRKRNTDLNRKEPVRLRQRRIKNGGYSLYLDTYWNGKRSYDFLKLYLNPPTDDLAVIENKTTLELAKQIKYKRILELQTGVHGSAVITPRPKFRDLFAEFASGKITIRQQYYTRTRLSCYRMVWISTPFRNY